MNDHLFYLSIKEQLAANKSAIIKARESGNDELAKILSQEKESLKIALGSRCRICGRILQKGGRKNGMDRRCNLHLKRRAIMKMKLSIASLALILFSLPLMAAPSSNQGGAFAYFTFPQFPPDFSHYTLYYGTSSSNYTFTVIGTTTNLSVINLVRGTTYYFNVTQSTTNGIESDYTTEVSLTIPNKPPKAQALAAQPQ